MQKNRWSGKFPEKPIVTKEQKEFMKKLQRAIVVANNNHRPELSEAAMAVLEFLPNSPVLAAIMSELFKLTPEIVMELRTLFDVKRVGDH